jgi:hypothetical protein
MSREEAWGTTSASKLSAGAEKPIVDRAALFRSIVGDARGVLARRKFSVFATIAAVLAPKASFFFMAARDVELASRESLLRRRSISTVRSVVGHDMWRMTPDERPKGARRITLHSRFPSTADITYLVSTLGYDGSAAFATMVRGHLPWMYPTPDRRKSRAVDPEKELVKAVGAKIDTEYTEEALRQATRVATQEGIADPQHPYIPAAPSCRKTVGGGFKKERVSQALARRRWDDNTRAAIFEIVYQRQSTKRVAAARGLRVETLYPYASSLRADLRA